MADRLNSPNIVPIEKRPRSVARVKSARLIKASSGKPKSNFSNEYEFLRSLPVFAGVPANELKLLADSSRFASFDSGQYVSIEGDNYSSYGFILVSGCVAMSKTSINGKELIVELLHAHDIFGLLVMLAADKVPAQLSARCLGPSMVLWVQIDNFTHMLRSNVVLFKEFVAHLLFCLQSSYGLSRGLAHDRVEVRIAAVLLSLALKRSKSSLSDASSVLNFTRQQLADLTGTTPETAIRVTRAMQHDGIIDIKRPGVIRVLSQAALQRIVES